MMRLCAVCLMWIAATFCRSFAAQAGEFDLLDRSRPEVSQMLRNHFRRRAHEALDRRLEQYELLKTPEHIHAWQKRQRDKFRELLGGFPERTPLNARVVGTLLGDGCRAEKIIYESRPGFRAVSLWP